MPAATSGSVATVALFSAEPGDAWPPPGKLGISVEAERIPFIVQPLFTPYEGLWNLVLVRLPAPTGRSEGTVIRNCAELESTGGLVDVQGSHRMGTMKVGDDRTLSALLTVDDTPENRQASWVLASESFGWGTQGYAVRCGTTTLTP